MPQAPNPKHPSHLTHTYTSLSIETLDTWRAERGIPSLTELDLSDDVQDVVASSRKSFLIKLVQGRYVLARRQNLSYFIRVSRITVSNDFNVFCSFPARSNIVVLFSWIAAESQGLLWFGFPNKQSRPWSRMSCPNG